MDNESLRVRKVFSERFRGLREERNMTQAEFAAFLGLSKTTISLYERSDSSKGRLPDAESLSAICKKLYITADYLLGLTDYKNHVGSWDDDEGCYNALKSIGFSGDAAYLIMRWHFHSQGFAGSINTLNTLCIGQSGIDMFIGTCQKYFDACRMLFEHSNNLVEAVTKINEEDFAYHERKLNEMHYLPISIYHYPDYVLKCEVEKELVETLSGIREALEETWMKELRESAEDNPTQSNGK